MKVKLRVTITPKGPGSVVDFTLHLGGPAMFGPIGAVVAAALRSDIDASLSKFVQVFASAS
ncbi:Toxin [Mycobacteroides abscessus subsp. massiliense]|nr:Toxin [Mycobacteroides abscessus subsp. massiliense]